MEKQIYINGKKIVEESAIMMRRLSAHYISHLGDSKREIDESLDMLKHSAKLYLISFFTYRPVISNENDLERALAIVNTK